MVRDNFFTVRVNVDERDLLKAVATRLDRSESDTVRWLIRVAAHELCPTTSTQHVARARDDNDDNNQYVTTTDT